LLHAEWTKFRTLRGWVIAMVIAAVLIGVIGVLLPRGQVQCGSGTGAACLASVPAGPGGEAVNDTYYLAGQPLAGNGSITVEVTSLTGMIARQAGPPSAAHHERGPRAVGQGGNHHDRRHPARIPLCGDDGHRQPRRPHAV
jgi:hypothetical protein